MTDDSRNSAHRDLVKALGDARALDGMSGAWLESGEWTHAVERVRAERFPDIPSDEAFQAVGRLLGETYLSSDVGKLLLQSLTLLPPERVFMTVIPAMAQRLRPGFGWTWEPRERGGVLLVKGKRATPATVTLGVLETLASKVTTAVRVVRGLETDDVLELVFAW